MQHISGAVIMCSLHNVHKKNVQGHGHIPASFNWRIAGWTLMQLDMNAVPLELPQNQRSEP